MKCLVFLMLIFSMVFVLVGNSISFHSHQVENQQKQSAYQNSEVQDSSGLCGDHDVDPCASGHCHMGHCAFIQATAESEVASPVNEKVLFVHHDNSLVDRAIEGPFQPPKRV